MRIASISTALGLFALTLPGCGSSPSPSPIPSPSPTPPPVRADQSFLGVGYGCISNPDAGYPVSVHLVDPATGALRLHPEGFPNSDSSTSAVALGPLQAGRRLLYLGIHRSAPTLSAVDTYRVDGEGRLTRLGTRAGVDDYAAELAVDPRGRFLFVAVDGTRIGPGDLVRLVSMTVTDEGFPRRVDPPADVPFPNIGDVVVDPAGRFLYAVSPAGSGLAAYAIDPTRGVLSALPGSPFRGDPTGAIAMHPSGRFLFTAEQGRRRIRTHLVDPESGFPVAASTSGFSGLAIELFVEPKGRFLYMIDLESERIWAWVVHDAGVLSTVLGSPFPTGPGPWSLASDAEGRYLYVGTQPSPYGPGIGVGPQIWGHRIDPETGALSPLSGFPYVPPTVSCPLHLTQGP